MLSHAHEFEKPYNTTFTYIENNLINAYKNCRHKKIVLYDYYFSPNFSICPRIFNC